MTEKEKMKLGLWYDANFDQELVDERLKAEDLCDQFNRTRPSDRREKEQILRELFGDLAEGVSVLSPVFADYGYLTELGEGTFINHGCYLMDGGGIHIGKHCFIGPNCGFYTANHPLLADERNRGFETAHPIVLEDNVWIGADTTILPGVTIGEGAVIGAKSLVTKDIPAGVLAYGNPCKVIRPITRADSITIANVYDIVDTGDESED